MKKIQCQRCLSVFTRKEVPQNCPNCPNVFSDDPIYLSNHLLQGDPVYDAIAKPVVIFTRGKHDRNNTEQTN